MPFGEERGDYDVGQQQPANYVEPTVYEFAELIVRGATKLGRFIANFCLVMIVLGLCGAFGCIGTRLFLFSPSDELAYQLWNGASNSVFATGPLNASLWSQGFMQKMLFAGLAMMFLAAVVMRVIEAVESKKEKAQ